MISTRGVSYCYDSGKNISFQDLNAKTGEHWLLQGESGCGKTTLLHLLGGLLRPQHGKIEVNGINISTLSESGLDQFRGKNYGFVFQKNHLINALSVEKNLLMSPFLAGLKQDQRRVAEVLEQLGLADKRTSRVEDLSQGQAQRVAIARAILNRPSVILADEPTSALDDRNCNKVIDLLLHVANQNKATLIIATHDQRLISKVSNQLVLTHKS